MSKLREALITTLRTLTANETLQVDFSEAVENNFFSWNQNLLRGGRAVVHESRASADLAAAYSLFHNPEIHQDQQFFNEFERARVLAEMKDLYHGAAQNVLTKIESDLAPFEKGAGLLLPSESKTGDFLSLILLDEVFAKNFSADLKKNLSKEIVTAIKNLRKKTSNQEAFSQEVARLLTMLESEEKSEEKSESESENENKNEKESGTESLTQSQSSVPNESGDAVGDPVPQESKEEEVKGELGIRLGKSEAEEEKIEFKKSYKIYSTKFDEVIFPQKLVSKQELQILRDQLELRLAKLNHASKKMTLKLKRKLLSKRDLFLEFDSSRGILDRKKLTRLVTKPLAEDVWVSNKSHEYQDTVLTILLDNSGSMRGQPIVMSALACEIIAEILEKFSIKTEIIGFTTADWKGGRARKLWESSGRPENPGRLNELRHIIYKHFNQKFKKAKTNLGLMLKEGVLKENIDGEALLFARSRLMQQSEKRKILMVISDGTPVDDSTNSANDSDILTDHLHHVIKKIEKSKKIEIVGIGIGHATDEFYHNSTTIKSPEELGDVMIEKIVSLL